MTEGYLGVDVGSVSMKMAVVDNEGKVLAKIYYKNKGIVDTIKRGLVEIDKQLDNVEIKSVACTGSGREFTKLLLGADLVKTEILAHTVATMHFYPEVRSIFDIGGEDCKIITLEKGIWKNYIMNNICGAGTGAMIESIATSLNIPIEEVGDLALKSTVNLSFPGKCGVLCQSAVVSRKNKGAKTEDILMGVCRALINNYLTLAKSIELEPPYVFQGATAQNKALVKALEEQLGHEMNIPKDCALMGAIGMALLAKENKPEKTQFRGFQIKDFKMESETFICEDCPNSCEVTRVKENNETRGHLGSRCGKYA